MAVSDGPKWNVMRHHQADRRLDLVGAGAGDGPVYGGRSDSAVDYMIDLMVFKCENFRKTAPNLIEHGHGNERLPAVRSSNLCGSDGDRGKIIVAEFAGCRITLWVIPEVRTVTVPLANSRRTCKHSLFRCYGHSAAKHR